MFGMYLTLCCCFATTVIIRFETIYSRSVGVNSEDVIECDFIGHRVIEDDIPIDHGLSQAVFCKGDGDQPSQRDSWQCVTGVSWTRHPYVR